ncbi:glycosyltransferase [Shewanella sp. WXL01]|uniref:glycosyltransferase n=1 Tax=Shewanella sp. WXL01 TaxID=2709721 RepID=UPI0014385B3D|nr:glycosyltransferase [Shewanella sp. WXL01]NKF50097.1 glycosyltransferase [Shewanella sp. WXL01]
MIDNDDKQFVVQASNPIPSKLKTVCGMSVYKQDKLEWIKRAVDSILRQTLPPCLYVVVIDGNVDEQVSKYLATLELSESSVVLVHSQSNIGLARCMNFVIDFVQPHQPDYFFRMDADDISVPHRFEKQVELLDSHADVDVLGSALWEVDEKENRVGVRHLPKKHTALIKSLARRCPINHPTVAIRYKVFEQGHRYLGHMLNTQDYFLWVELAAAGYKFANVKEPLLHFRRINGFYKRRGRGKSINEFKARLMAMRLLNQVSVVNLTYATMVLTLRMMPGFIIKWAYYIDRRLMKMKKNN